MKKLLLLIILCSSLFAENTFKIVDGGGVFYVDDQEVGKCTVYKGKIDVKTLEVPDGTYIEKYADGKIKGEYPVKNKLWEGTWKFYNSKGALEEEQNFVESKRDGVSYKYYPNGKILAKVTFSNNKQNGEYKTYYNTGALQMDSNYRNGLLEGHYTEYFYNGKEYITSQFKKGKETGERIEFNILGNTVKKWDCSGNKPVLTEEAPPETDAEKEKIAALAKEKNLASQEKSATGEHKSDPAFEKAMAELSKPGLIDFFITHWIISLCVIVLVIGTVAFFVSLALKDKEHE